MCAVLELDNAQLSLAHTHTTTLKRSNPISIALLLLNRHLAALTNSFTMALELFIRSSFSTAFVSFARRRGTSEIGDAKDPHLR